MRITISKQLIREHGSRGSALHMLGLADRVDSKGNIKPRNKHKRHTARKPGAGAHKPAKGKGSYDRQKAKEVR